MVKTSFVLNIAMNAAIDSRKPTALLSRNMSKEDVSGWGHEYCMGMSYV